MNYKTRLKRLEAQQNKPNLVFHFVTIDQGIVTKTHNAPPELLGKTEAEVSELYEGRKDAKLIFIVYASQAQAASIEG